MDRSHELDESSSVDEFKTKDCLNFQRAGFFDAKCKFCKKTKLCHGTSKPAGMSVVPSSVEAAFSTFEHIDNNLAKLDELFGRLKPLGLQIVGQKNGTVSAEALHTLRSTLLKNNQAFQHATVQTKNDLLSVEVRSKQAREDALEQKRRGASASIDMRKDLLSCKKKKFSELILRYNQESRSLMMHVEEMIGNQIKATNPELLDCKVEDIIEQGAEVQYMQGEVDPVTTALLTTVARIETRHKQIQELERDVADAAQLFSDLAALVEMQQESVDIISERIAQTKKFTLKAGVQIEKASRY